MSTQAEAYLCTLLGLMSSRTTESLNERTRLLGHSPVPVDQERTCAKGCSEWADNLVARNEEDDVVSLGVKQLCFVFSLTIMLWLVTFFLIVVDILLRGVRYAGGIEMFIPMWIGTAIGMVGCIAVSRHVVRHATLISTERRQYLLRHHVDGALFVDYDSLPLMRRLLCWNVGLFITLLLVLISQSLFAVWFLYGTVSLWHALIPALILTGGYLMYLMIMDVVSLTCFSLVALSVTQMVLLVLKCNRQLALSWTLACTPCHIVLPCALAYVLSLLLQHARGRCALHTVQQWAACAYALSIVCIEMAVCITTWREYSAHIIWSSAVDSTTPNGDLPVLIDSVQYVLSTIAVTLFTISVAAVLNLEGRTLADTRGFPDPTPLSRYPGGWDATRGAGDVYTILLGTIVARLPRGGVSAGDNQSTGASRVSQGRSAVQSPSRTPPRRSGSSSGARGSAGSVGSGGRSGQQRSVRGSAEGGYGSVGEIELLVRSSNENTPV